MLIGEEILQVPERTARAAGEHSPESAGQSPLFSIICPRSVRGPSQLVPLDHPPAAGRSTAAAAVLLPAAGQVRVRQPLSTDG